MGGRVGNRWRRWLLAGVLLPLLPVLVVGAAALYNASVPDSPTAPGHEFEGKLLPRLTAETTLKVVTFNIQNTWVVGHHRPARMRAIARNLAALDPDLAAFQEALVDDDRAILLRALQASRLKYQHYFRSRRLGSGLLICSAWPIRETWFQRFSQSGEWYKPYEGDWWVGKGIALARVELPGGALLDFYTTHTQAGYGNPRYHQVRQSQMNELAAFVNRTRNRVGPALFVGDLNCRPPHAEYQSVVKDAGLERMMTIPSGVDDIFAVRDPQYAIGTVETRRIEERIQAEDGSWTDLSDHPGFLSVIRLRPIK